MDLQDFRDKVGENPALEIDTVKAMEAKDDFILITNKPNKQRFKVTFAAVEQHDWPLLEAVFVGSRDPAILVHISRPVGYYSRIENWNKSLIGQLKDRHAGQYTIPEDLKWRKL